MSLGSNTTVCAGTFGRSEVPLPWNGVHVVPPSVVRNTRPIASGTTVEPSAMRGAVDVTMYTCPSCAPALKFDAFDGNAMPVVEFSRLSGVVPVPSLVGATTPPAGVIVPPMSVNTTKPPPPPAAPYSRHVCPPAAPQSVCVNGEA
jgi:hypothetical protein